MGIFEDFWKDPRNVHMNTDAKVIWFFLAGNCSTVSGIYFQSISEIAIKTKVPEECVSDLLIKKKTGIQGIMYDAENEMVFVVDWFDHPRGGRPDKIIQGIMNNCRKTWRAKTIWTAFRERYSKFIHANPELQEFFLMIEKEQNIYPKKRKARSTLRSRIDYEFEIQRMLNAYTISLSEKDRECVFKTYSRITRCTQTLARRSVKMRYMVLKRLSNQDPQKVADVCSNAPKNFTDLIRLIKNKAKPNRNDNPIKNNHIAR